MPGRVSLLNSLFIYPPPFRQASPSRICSPSALPALAFAAAPPKATGATVDSRMIKKADPSTGHGLNLPGAPASASIRFALYDEGGPVVRLTP